VGEFCAMFDFCCCEQHTGYIPVLKMISLSSDCMCVQAASPACTELETIVLDWLGLYCEKVI